MTKKQATFSRKLYKYLLLIAVSITVLHVILQYINIVQLNENYGTYFEITNRFDLDDEASIPTWYSQLLFLVLSGFGWCAAYLDRKNKTKSIWITIAVIALLGSLDEVSTVHESGLQSLHLIFFNENTPTVLANAWIIIVPLVLIFVLAFIVKAVKVLPRNTVKLLVVSIVLYLCGAVGVDILTSTLIDTKPFIEQGLLVALEESLELFGISTAILAVSSYLEQNHKQQIASAISELKK